MRRALRILAIVVVAVAVLLVAAVLAVQPLATWRTRKALSHLEGMRARFSTVEVSLRDLSYTIRGLRIDKRAADGEYQPFFEARSIRVGLLSRELWHRHLVAHVDLERPRMSLVEEGGEKAGRAPKEEVKKVPSLAQRLGNLGPLRIDRVQVRDGEIRWTDAREPEQPTLRFHGVEATLENLATRPALSRGEPTVLAARGVLQDTGQASFFATADPLAKKLTFAGQGRVEHLDVKELGSLLASKTDVKPTQGRLDLTVRFECENGELTGGIRPLLQGAETKAAKKGIGPKLKSFLADASLHIFKNDVPGEQAVATTIPIQGRLDDPKLQLVPTILGVVRNAFVRGLSASLQGLPPPEAPKKEGALEQARRALSPGRGNQPRAQPEGKR
jgi:uncharacterized protein YhdP